MLRIRPEQLTVFQPQAEALFLEEVAKYLRKRHARTPVRYRTQAFAVQDMPDALLRSVVSRAVDRGRGYGLTQQSTLTAFVALMFVVAPNFDRHPLIRHALTDKSVAPDERISKLWERTTKENWATTKQEYDPQAW